ILNLTNEFVVASFDYNKYLSIEGSKDILGFTFKYREDPIILDPRNKNLGARLIINLEKLYLSLKKLELKNDKIDNYYLKSHSLGIVPKNLNKLKNKLFGIECNYEELNAIDFKKGCYVGQENTARIRLKNKLSKRLLPIEIIKGKLIEDEKIFNNDIEIGKVLINEDYPFALVRFLDKNFDKNVIFKSKNGSFKIFIPDWLMI
ncbi:tRNA-modifying protein YgfZ, partial [Candidatus Pelagibacter sp.]|nr:tRNA-modifying protein YgfZ [Candidatus Pelagibacter sp.]